MADKKRPESVPGQEQSHQPGIESEMDPRPDFTSNLAGVSKRLDGKTAMITGGDSGIGRAVAVAYAKEGADVAIVYLEEDSDAKETKEYVEKEGAKCLLIPGDVGDEEFCQQAIQKTIDEYGKLDILVNNAGEQHPQDSIEDITKEQLTKTFSTNIFSMFYLTKEALKHMGEGASIINTSSITAYQGMPQLIDYSATKGAITTFTRSLSQSLIDRKIRVNAVAPGPIWTPLIPSTFSKETVDGFGGDAVPVPMKRPGQPAELAGSYVFLASEDASYITGQMIHVNGGTIVNG
ncbi:glucose 1-dehydrogenase [Rossellomorea vietnamensis]|uniref:Glucose 1-dehydrogenase n=1 Tax=Rossellomorea vietnamensis TaxID=218284 RepID=A0A5D4MFX4_9BACI|nr:MULTISPECIES: SDR family oxidoreductase [Bacillaceae]TYS00359.1 glucose 1-dehydrogenase [Rossellomorea vietnamensis]